MFRKEATKRGSSIARIPEMSYCTFVLFKDTLVESDSACVDGVTSLFHTNGKNSCFIEDARESKEGIQTIFFTSLNRVGENPDEEEPSDDLSKQRKVHHHSGWKPRQDAVYWINLTQAREKGPQVWQTKSHAIVVCSSVPAECIYKVISQTGELYLKDSRRLIPHRR